MNGAWACVQLTGGGEEGRRGGEWLLGQGEAPDPQGSSEEAGEPSEGVSGLRAPLNGVVRTGRPGAPPEQAEP